MNFVKFTFILICIMMINTATCQENIYQNLASEEIKLLYSNYQENSTTPLQKYYLEADECKSEYPFYSYNLALKCRRIVIIRNIDSMVSTNGTEVTINNMSSVLKNTSEEVGDNLQLMKNNNLTFQSIEWLSLAERNYQESKYYYSISQDQYNYPNQSTTLDALAKTEFAIYKTRKLLKMVEDKNKLYPKINSTQLSCEGEKVASEWIEAADKNLSILTKSGKRKDIAIYCESNINIAKEYFYKENYYMAIMTAAEIKALADYGVKYEKFNTSQDAIIYAENQLKNANNSLKTLLDKNNIDAPIAMLHIETAQIRMEEAKNEDSINSIPLADSVTRNSLIANEQVYAIMEYKEAIKNIDETSEKTRVERIPIGIPPFFVVLLVYLSLRRKVT